MAIIDYEVRVVVEAGTPNPHYYRKLQTDVIDDTLKDPSHTGDTHRDFAIEESSPNIPTASINTPASLDIRVQVGSAIVDDDTTLTADADNLTTIKASVLRKDLDSSLEVWIFTKTTGEYDALPSGYTEEIEKIESKEWKIVAAGTVIEEI